MLPGRIALENIRVASPCTVQWEEMAGNSRIRFCDHCRRNVYDISELSKQEAEDLIKAKEGQLCVQYYIRKDGTIVTNDCPPISQAIRRTVVRGAAFCIALASFVVGLRLVSTDDTSRGGAPTSLSDMEPFATILDWLNPRGGSRRVGGAICIHPPSTVEETQDSGE